MGGLIRYLSFCVHLVPFSVVCSRLAHIAIYLRDSFPFKAE